MGARKLGEKFPIQVLSLHAITVDLALQSRVKTILEYQREFSEAMLRGDVFPPIVVFFDGKKYWLADGFHRFGAAKQAMKVNPKLKGIRAEVRTGSKQDALVFSAGANREFSIKRTAEDIRKAVFMLMEVPEWLVAATTRIAKHVGISSTTVDKHRAAYCNEKGMPIPSEVVKEDGTLIPRMRQARENARLHVNKQKRCTAYFTKINGQKHYLGINHDVAETKLKEIQEEFDSRKARLQPDGLAQYFMHRDLTFKGAGFNPSQYPGLSAYSGHGVVYVAERFERRVGSGGSQRSIPEAVGCLLMARAHLDPTARAVMVCFADELLPTMLDLGRKLGIEFLSPDELVASVKEQEAIPCQP